MRLIYSLVIGVAVAYARRLFPHRFPIKDTSAALLVGFWGNIWPVFAFILFESSPDIAMLWFGHHVFHWQGDYAWFDASFLVVYMDSYAWAGVSVAVLRGLYFLWLRRYPSALLQCGLAVVLWRNRKKE